ncbi:adenosylcobinamide-phosphate synthase CbiB [Bacillus alkalicellulosilyticus]|uniref:adenosylcobinamide-phosphate synthase CbiB n=1 Tax=Alkalihalobacterium alkalicellulosilyticum TaxID=1912214 RepID=UPI00099715B1|nr:adenosylcobinamide-phosphate synthase CbiB [Bacillus alkalicellulosilyticus]
MILHHLIALTLAVLLDRVIGDPRSFPHPVVWIGRYISFLEKRLWSNTNQKRNGIFLLVMVVMTVFVLTTVIIIVFYQLHVIAGIIVEAILICYAIAQRSLREAAELVYQPLQEGNVEDARRYVSYIVGRDTEQFGEAEIVRATVETVAENTSDGITAPLFYALLGGAPLAFAYRAINTCDSMVGYKNEKYVTFGWASARMDDVVNWIPSRMTGILMIIINRPTKKISKKQAFSVLFQDAKRHPSPNSGWGEAAVAALLGVQLGGQNTYKGIVSNRAKMGRPLVVLTKKHIKQAVTIMNRAVYGFVILLWVLGGIYFGFTFTWS